MRTILKIFFKAGGNSSWLVLACLLVASLIEGIGYASLIPMLSVAVGTTETDSSPLIDITEDIMTTLGLPMNVGILLTFFVTTMILKSLLAFLANSYVGIAVANFTMKLRKELLANIFNVRWGYFIHKPIGRFTNAFGAQAGKSGKAFQVAATFLALLIQAIAYLCVSFVISWPLALAGIGVGLILATSLSFLVRIARKAGIRQTQYGRELSIFLTDTLINIKPIRAMTRQAAFFNLLEGKIKSLKKAIKRGVLSTEGLKNGQDILIVIILGIGFYSAITYWDIPIIDLAVVGILLKKTTNNITKLQRTYQGAVAIERPYIELSRLITKTGNIPEHNPGKLQASYAESCRLKEVTFSHGDNIVLQSVNMEIPAGHITVLTGPSGSGKTTIADIILGLYPPDKGRITIDGVSLQDIDLNSWRRLVGYVPQEVILFNDSIYANISLGNPEITPDVARDALIMAGAWEFIEAKPEGMMTKAGQHGAKFSGGQRQRISIARALALKPRLLILDEVTSALDPQSEIEICQNIKRLSGQTSVLAITHRPALLEIADRVYKIEGGVAIDSVPLPPTTIRPRP